MVPYVTGLAASAITRRSIYGKLYNREPRRRDRIMPTVPGMQYFARYGSQPSGFRMAKATPIITPSLEYKGLFANADLPPVERPLPWDRIIK